MTVSNTIPERLIFDAGLKNAQTFWNEHLPREASDSGLPLDFKRSKIYSPKLELLKIELPDDVHKRLVTLAGDSSLLIYTTLLAALKVTIRRYTTSDTIIVGSPLALVKGKPEPSPNVVAIATGLRDELPFRELLEALRTTLVRAYEHQHYPFDHVVEQLGIAVPENRCPLFDVVASLEGFHGVVPPLKHDATFHFSSAAKGLSLGVRFNARLLHRDTIAGFIKSYLQLLRSGLENPASSIGSLEILSVKDASAILDQSRPAAATVPDVAVTALFEAQVDRTPDAIAVECQGHRLTYRELDERANRLAHFLRSEANGLNASVKMAGAASLPPVGICMFPSLDLYVGLLGILKSGAPYLPLDPKNPSDRLSLMLDDAQPRLILTHPDASDRLAGARTGVICIEEAGHLIADFPSTRPASPNPADLAYIIFTSGSNGRPKGVCMLHRALCNLLIWDTRRSNFKAGTKTLQRTSIGFDVSFQEIFATLCSGGTLVAAPAELQNDLWRLPRFLVDERIEQVFLPFVALQQLAKAMLVQQRFPASLREIVTAGERLRITQPIMDAFRQLEGCSLVNQYGPTETHVVTSFTLDGPSIRWPALPPIGQPIDSAHLYLLDAGMHPVPVGAVGELNVGGVPLARGYLNQPELTAARFPQSPFSADPGVRLYRTGDLARRRRDGTFEFLGRIDRQIKIRGHRVELGEVEAVLSQHSAVGEVAAMGRVDDAGETRLVAWVIPADGHLPLSAELRRFLEDKLVPAMIPAIFVRIAELPLTSTGKVDYAALPAPDWAHPELGGAHFPARTSAEQLLAAIWREVLGIEECGVSDNFLSLGGDSILATQVVARASQAGLAITLRDVFRHQTIGELALVAAASEAPVVEDDVAGPAPLTAIQCWFFEQRLPNPNHWNMDVLLETREPLDFGVLEQAMRLLVAHHDALLLRFRRDGLDYSQVRGAEPSQSLAVVRMDISKLSPEAQDLAIAENATELQTRLNIADGPLVLVALFDLGSGRPGRLLFTAHHLVMDGVSLRIVIADIEAAYLRLLRSEPVAMPPRTTSFTRWSRLASAFARSDRAREELDFWTRPVERPSALPRDFPGGSNTQACARSIEVTLDAAATRALLTVVPEVHGAQIEHALLTALTLALFRWTGETSSFIDVEGHGREEVVDGVSLARTVGWFTSLFPVRFDIGDHTSPADTLRSIRRQLQEVPNHGIGYGVLRYLGDPTVAARLSSQPQPEIAFNYLGQFDQVLSSSQLFNLANEPARQLCDPRGERSHLLYVGALIVLGQLRIELRFSEQVHRASTIAALGENLVDALHEIIAAPRTKLKVSPAELEAIRAAVGRPEQPGGKWE